MKSINGDNIYSIGARTDRAVVNMPSRRRDRFSAVVVAMPTRDERQSKIVMLPARSDSSGLETPAGQDGRYPNRSDYGALSYGVRMTLVALFALLGWPHPTRDNDPGPSAARPCRWELTSLISRMRLPAPGTKTAAAATSVLEFPGERIGMNDDVLARAS